MVNEETKLIMEAMIELLECQRGQPNKYTQDRLIKEMSEITHKNNEPFGGPIE